MKSKLQHAVDRHSAVRTPQEPIDEAALAAVLRAAGAARLLAAIAMTADESPLLGG